MQNQKSTKDKNRQPSLTKSINETENELRARLERLCKCDRILSDSEIADFGDTSKFDTDEEIIVVNSDAYDEDLVTERLKLSRLLDLPEDTHSLTKIVTNLPPCLKYSFRSGLTHMNMQKFSPLTRGHQGSAIAVAAIATSYLIKPQCWNEPVIDQVIEDGDTYYSDSYAHIETDDRRTLKLLDLKRELDIRKTHRISVKIDEPIFAGTFRSETWKDLHVAKALDLFFKKYDAGVLTSPVLNVAIWKSSKYFNFFDGQARLENCEIADPEAKGFARLILLKSIPDILYVILEKSKVKNEPFVLYGVDIVDARKLSEIPDENEKTFVEPQRRPSGYRIQDKYRAVVHGSYHLMHPILPEEFQGRGHLVLAVTALVYSRLLSGSKWTKVIIDLIFNQSNIYLTDLARVLGKSLDHTFELRVNDLLCDVVLGVYTAKIKVEENVIPGQGKKGKTTVDTGIREFFAAHPLGILEIKKIYYAIWKEKNKFYILDPFACDMEGFRVDSRDPADAERYKKAAACVTMNSSVNQVVETILENTESKDKDPFIIHGLDVLYVKTGTAQDGSDEKVVFREKKTNRRPLRPPSSPSTVVDDCEVVIDSLPRPKLDLDEPVNVVVQYPELMSQVELFMKTVDKEKSAASDEENEDIDQEIDSTGYKIINPLMLTVRGTKNCLSQDFSEQSRGRQGLVIALAALAESEQTNLTEWTSLDIDKIIYDGHSTYERIVSWIHRGSSEDALKGDVKGDMKEVLIKSGSYNEDSYQALETSSAKGLDYMSLPMLPENLKIGDTDVNLIWKMNVVKGKANPLANLGEAFENYFEKFDQVILENNKLMYAIWKKYDHFFILNPYGNDPDGWQNCSEPAALFVVDRVVELVNLLYGLLQFNDFNFTLHFIKLTLPSSDGNIGDLPKPEISELKMLQQYKTKFLPVTDADLAEIKIREEEIEQPNEDNLTDVLESEVNNSKRKSYNLDEESMNTRVPKEAIGVEKDLRSLFKMIAEPKEPDAPARLNLSLVTGIVKIEHLTEDEKHKENLELLYEKLKYTHPPPFVLPPKKNLCALLDVKLASKSVQSLLSRFSIDSKLAIKEKNDLLLSAQQDITISLYNIEKSKLITLPPKKYFFSKSLPSGLTPIRAINEQFIRDKVIDEDQEKDCRRKKKEKEIIMIPDDKPNLPKEQILPMIIPLGPCIKTPEPIRKIHGCPERKKRKCLLTAKEKEDAILKKLVCSTENLLFEMMFPDFKGNTETPASTVDHPNVESADDDTDDSVSTISLEPEPCGFKPTTDANIGIINANTCLEDRATLEDSHYKSCYFAAIIAILAKINVSVNVFRSGVVDRIIRSAKKIGEGTGKLRYKMSRWFRNFNILGVKYNIILKQTRYADPENYEPDALKNVMKSFFEKHQTGIVVFGNVAYAFWFANDTFYLFDPYACDENGLASVDGSACLMQICDFDSFVERIIQNTGETAGKPYRLYTMSIAHLETEKKEKKRKRKKKRVKSCKKQLEEEQREAEEVDTKDLKESESETSLIELTDWVNKDRTKILIPNPAIPGFLSIANYNASALEVEILENEITRPILAPLKEDLFDEPTRQTPYDRTFYSNSVMSESMDLCIMAWSQIYDPPIWSTRTIQALFEASKEYALDSLLASEDSTVPRMTDNLLTEFNIANYNFRIVFAPMHTGTLYAKEGWNLAKTLEKIFQSPVYTGAVLVCENAHIGVMKKGQRLYAWWLVKGTKKIRIIVSDDAEGYLKLVVKEINQPGESEFSVRIVTISYAKILGPNCSDIEGLHESLMPSSSIAEIHAKDMVDQKDEAVFRLINKSQTPVFILGTVALSERDTVTEPRVKRCYFVALFTVMLKRDIIQNPLPEMIDRILKLAESSYKLFEEPKYHTEHILKDVRIMDRVFEFRDCSSQLTSLQNEKKNTNQMFFPAVKKQLKEYFKKCTSGILHLSNCCYGFWYSATTNCYYYLDPYQCDVKGRRVANRGKSCLCVFSSIKDLARQMCINQFEETTGFFIHRVHVELVNESPYLKFKEDPIWIYLDYHWSYRHLAKPKAQMNSKKTLVEEVAKKPSWKNYLIEVPNTIYSVWGTLSSFDVKFGPRAGKNQAAIGVALFAMYDLCHPSAWSTIVLDSAVVCGDCYYKDSKKLASRCCNRFNLAKCFKLSPYLWDVEFTSDICGVLYGNSDQPSLASALEHALGRSSNLLLQCDKKILTILQTNEAFYAMDSSWIGPPLFSKDRGAIYVIRCKSTKTLIYVLTKMLNTNQRLEFSVTPVRLKFNQETCQSSDSKPKVSRKKILQKPARSAPGKTVDHSTLVNGSIVVPEEDSYLCYSRNLKLGLVRGAEFENPPTLDERKSSILLRKKQFSGKGATDTESSRGSRKSGFKVELDRDVSSMLERKVDSPRVLNFIRNVEASRKEQCGGKALAVIHESQKESEFDKSFMENVDAGYRKMIPTPKYSNRSDIIVKSGYDKNRFDIRSSFVYEESREMFESYNAEMKKEAHHVSSSKNKQLVSREEKQSTALESKSAEVRRSYEHVSSSEYKQVESHEEKQSVVGNKSTVISIMVENVDEAEVETSNQDMIVEETGDAHSEVIEEEEEIPEEQKKFRSSLHLNIK